MIKILHTADWHLGQFKGPQENGVNLRFMDTVNCLNHMVHMAQEDCPDLVCISGDIFDKEQVGPNRYTDEVLEAARIIEDLAHCSGYVIVMRGTPNHDGTGIFRVLAEMLKHRENVAVVTTPQVIATPVADVACVPGFNKQDFRANFPGLSAEEENQVWTEYITNIVVGLRMQCREGVPAILMAHYTVPGCNMESGQTAYFANFEPVIPTSAIKTAGYDAAFLGHIHRPQKLPDVKNVFYSGSINALNFNDEGQERGFYFHEFDDTSLINSEFVVTPYRPFHTIDWKDDDVGAYLQDGLLFLQCVGYREFVQDHIVRLRYSCSADKKKALNIMTLQEDLYSLGAFYVADIEAGHVIEMNNRGLLSEESDPLPNLKKWLEEKEYENQEAIMELAEPIIVRAAAKMNLSRTHGAFRPVSIAVKNYRNYVEESFDFTDISFCTINGTNGAGKSSLFMDAMADCLFEETREGKKGSWLREGDGVKKGSIELVFDVGDQRFRIVRTRTKAGVPTLNLSQKNEDGWVNLSGERAADTQKEIEKVLGMDSMTFRSCALIMQDQYGLFLQAKRTERMEILSKILGLDVYGVMENIAMDARRVATEELKVKKNTAKVKEDIIREKGKPQEELDAVEIALQGNILASNTASRERDNIMRQISNVEDMIRRQNTLSARKAEIRETMAQTEDEIAQLKGVIESLDITLNEEVLINQKDEEYSQAMETVRKLEGKKTEYALRKLEADSIRQRLQEQENNQKDVQKRIESLISEKDRLQKEIPSGLDDGLAKLMKCREELKEQQDKHAVADAVSQAANIKITDISARKTDAEASLKVIRERLVAYRSQQEYINNSGCLDIEHASCRFLEKAKEDIQKIEETEQKEAYYLGCIESADRQIADMEQQRDSNVAATGYDPEREEQLKEEIKKLEVFEQQAARAADLKSRIEHISWDIGLQGDHLASYEKAIPQLHTDLAAAEATVKGILPDVETCEMAEKKAEELVTYHDQAQKVPLYKERKKNAEEKRLLMEDQAGQLQKESQEIAKELQDLQEQLSLPEMALINLNEQWKAQEKMKAEAEKNVTDLQIRKGGLLKDIEDMLQLQEEIDILKRSIDEVAARENRYSILRQAFSQEGIPHQIIRTMVPYITDTANSILGAMTGGTMGVEFVLDKELSNKKAGEKATLDVKVEEYGKSSLDYVSKSGGEKVKASLAVILALAELKTSSAGSQLGMLFIDEPPFLDSDGSQAYVDALETIHHRYPETKIMAITHDDSFRARFPQSVTVYKDAEGSHAALD